MKVHCDECGGDGGYMIGDDFNICDGCQGEGKVEGIKHAGVHVKRLNKEHNPREVAFFKLWQKENHYDQNSKGVSLLQHLMIERASEPKEGFVRDFSGMSVFGQYMKVHHHINQKEAEIVATTIQWLGSNVGMCFLGQALKECGKKIVKINNP